MSAERSTESIIDLLYGELSEDEAKQMREELADSVELQAEYDQLDAMLGRVREVMPPIDVAPSIHASILEAARAGAAASDDDRMMRRTPAAEPRSFWSRVGRGQGSQFALVAAVLVAGLFVVKYVDRGASPLNAPASDISAMEEAAPAMVASADRQQAAEGAESDEANTPAEAVADQWSPEPESEPEELKAAPPAPAEPVVAKAEAEPPADIAKSLQRELAVGTADKADPKPVRKRTKSKKKIATKDAPAKEMAPRTASTKSAPAPTAADKSIDLFADSDDLQANTSSSSTRVGSAQGKASLDYGSVGTTEDEAAPAPQYRAPANSIETVNQYFRKGDYNGAIGAADNFLSNNPNAPNSERATAMQIKAQSLASQGKYTEADRIYAAIQANYPSFQQTAIRNARSEIRQRDTKKQRKARPKADAAEQQYEFDSTSMD